MIPLLLNCIIFLIESADFSLNWKDIFLIKFKYWIESDRVSNTPNSQSWSRNLCFCESDSSHKNDLAAYANLVSDQK